jgi:uncharacterized protein (DUF58 family)
MVRELDRETMVTHWLVVDIGNTMREGRPGAARLDLAVDVAAAYARGALEAGDRVALVTYDGRIVGEAKPNDGPVHRLRIVERLMEAMSVVDEDLTELTDSELIAVVARYLLLQEGIDARLRRAPAIDDPVWNELAASPSGELYDLRVVHQAVAAALERHKKEIAPAAPTEPLRLRQYCRLRGIELPYRRTIEAGRRARGLGAALEHAGRARGSQRIVVLSDLQGLEGDLAPVARAVRLVRRRGHHLTFAVPEARIVADEDATPDRAIAADIAGHQERRRERAAVTVMRARLGVRVVAVSADSAALLLGRTVATPRARVA